MPHCTGPFLLNRLLWTHPLAPKFAPELPSRRHSVLHFFSVFELPFVPYSTGVRACGLPRFVPAQAQSLLNCPLFCFLHALFSLGFPLKYFCVTGVDIGLPRIRSPFSLPLRIKGPSTWPSLPTLSRLDFLVLFPFLSWEVDLTQPPSCSCDQPQFFFFSPGTRKPHLRL